MVVLKGIGECNLTWALVDAMQAAMATREENEYFILKLCKKKMEKMEKIGVWYIG